MLADIPATFADEQGLVHNVEYRPAAPVEEGVKRFVQRYRECYRVQRHFAGIFIPNQSRFCYNAPASFGRETPYIDSASRY